MAERPERTFIFETYVPQLDQRSAAEKTSTLSIAALRLNEAGVPVRLLRSLALVGEETHLCLITATELGDIIQLGRQAGLEPDHVAEAIAITLSPDPTDAREEARSAPAHSPWRGPRR
jgi:hypothetical protein